LRKEKGRRCEAIPTGGRALLFCRREGKSVVSGGSKTKKGVSCHSEGNPPKRGWFFSDETKTTGDRGSNVPAKAGKKPPYVGSIAKKQKGVENAGQGGEVFLGGKKYTMKTLRGRKSVGGETLSIQQK